MYLLDRYSVGPQRQRRRTASGYELSAAQHAARFVDPVTRMLLVNKRLTTPALANSLDTTLRVRVIRQDILPAERIPEAVRRSLRLPQGIEAMVRRSCLLDSESVPVSVNLVISTVRSAAATGLDDVTEPIGYSLAAHRISHRRKILRVGLARWPDGRAGAARAYLIRVTGQPLCYIRECFNPDLVSPELSDDRHDDDPDLSWGDEPSVRSHAVGPGSATLVWPEHRALQQPEWPDPESARDYFDQLRGLPPLVGADECEALTSELALAGTGAAFVLHLGDCVETFADCRTEALSARQALAAAAAAVLSYGTGRRVVTIGRIAGQYAKPRSQPVESETGLPTYRGDIVNSADPDPAARIPDPQRMLSGYFHAAATMNYLRAHPVPPAGPAVALLRRAADAGADLSAAALLGNVADIFEAAASAPVDCRQVHSLVPRLWVSHEALLLPYEHALTRYGHEGQWWDTSAHLLWIGDRTRDQRHPHIQLAERIGNPVAVKIGPTAEPEELAALCRRINPDKTPGRLTLIVRMGAHRAAPALPPLMAAAAATGIPVGWVCDPMHGNTHTAADGHKTRSLDDIAEEIRAFFEACRHTGTIPGGLHLETAPEDVTECVGGWGHLGEDDLSRNYRTRCDPRLNAVQTLQCVTLAVRELQSFPDPLS